jgi:MarR family transcriptional regulator, transcriptional regulator for hemolysin
MGLEATESSMRSLLRVAKNVRLCMEAALADAGASFADFVILDAISVERGLSQRQIARRLSIEGPPLTRHLERLEAEGLVARRRDEHDRRVQRVYPTAAGSKLYATLCPIVARLELDLLETVPAADAAAFARVLSHLRTRLEAREPAEAAERAAT